MHFYSNIPFIIALTLVPFAVLFFDAISGNSSLLSVLASVSGLWGGVLLWWQFAFGVHPIARLFTRDYAHLIALHIFLGTYGILIIALHTILELVTYQAPLSFLYTIDFSTEAAQHLTFGRLALGGLLIVWATSALLRRTIRYRAWRYLHFLSYPATALVFIHSINIGSYLESTPWVKALWFFFALTFVTMVLWRIADALRLQYYEYTLTRADRYGDVTVYHLSPRTSRHLIPQVGQFIYIATRRLSETHPFTIMHSDTATGEIVLGVKSFGTFTKNLATLPNGARLFLDGPYGVFTREGHNTEHPKVLIAGGIGITPFVDVVGIYGNESTYLFNCNRALESALFRDTLKEKLHDRYIDVLSETPETVERVQTIEYGYLCAETLTKYIPQDILSSAHFFICGPKPLMDTSKKILHSLGVSKNHIFTEEFSF